ncbi:3-hydroxybutyryl-CoA dehydrogenase [Thalictrum thalictroides]|uniref:3-hydroxybutyryl-CoA dehydrogenase n=1 Tax=Thalictrum thalictroides TaxID=46969 RepID=A0A7J6UZB2_THATH|nr:3-hydroxybutyryl-CoA dehydrogenase [Thalictrum thalictroides]
MVLAAEIKTVGVIRGGQMGSAIAQLALVSGIDVWLLDSDSNALTKATNFITTSIQRFVDKGQLSQEIGSGAIRRLKCTSRLEDLQSVIPYTMVSNILEGG